jgi:hypothetical protein
MFTVVRFFESGGDEVDVGIVWREDVDPDRQWRYKCRVCLMTGEAGMHTALDRMAVHFVTDHGMKLRRELPNADS